MIRIIIALAGISASEDEPGFKHILIKPAIAGDLKWVKGTLQTFSGLITTHWQRQGDQFLLDVNIPPNTRATVFVPTTNEHSVEENDRKAAIVQGLKFSRYEYGRAVYNISSGSYHFRSQLSTIQQVK